MTSRKHECWKRILAVCEYCPENSSLRPLVPTLNFSHTEIFGFVQNPELGSCQVWGMPGESTKHPTMRLSEEWSGRSMGTSRLAEPSCSMGIGENTEAPPDDVAS